MKRLARLYWQHEIWFLKAIVVDKEFFIAFLRHETLLVWYAVPVIVTTYAVYLYDAGGLVFWGLVGLAGGSYLWGFYGILRLSYSFAYLGDAIDFGWRRKTEPTISEKRLKHLQRKVGEP